MASAEPQAGQQAPSLVDVLRQLELRALERLVDRLAFYLCISSLRLTCRALRDLADGSVRIVKPLKLRLREDGAVTEPLAALKRWGRRGGVSLELQLPAEAELPGGVDALLPAAFAELPAEGRGRVTQLSVSRDPDVELDDPMPAVSGAAMGGLATSLPCLRKLDLSDLPSSWTPGADGEACAALAALGTLEELELPGVPGLTGVEALAGSLRSLKVSGDFTLTPAAAAPLRQLTRLEALELEIADLDLGYGPQLQTLLNLFPKSIKTLTVDLSDTDGPLSECTFGLSGGRLVSAKLGLMSLSDLAALARDELLPCLGLDGRLESLSVEVLSAGGWCKADVAPALELWRRSDQARVGDLTLGPRRPAADLYGAMTTLAISGDICLPCAMHLRIRLKLLASPPPDCGTPSELSTPPEVLRRVLQRITGGGQQAGAGEDQAHPRILLLRGPAAAAALEQPSSEAAVKAWAQELERRARDTTTAALGDGGALIEHALPLPPASAVLLQCGQARDELLPCLGLDGRLESLSVEVLSAGGWCEADVAPALELWRRSDQARVGDLTLGPRRPAADLYGAMTTLAISGDICLPCAMHLRIRLKLLASPPPDCGTPSELSTPPEVLRRVLQRITGGGQQAGAGEDQAHPRILLLRGPAAAAALEQPSSEAAVKAWAQELERRARDTTTAALGDGGALIEHALPLPPASAVLLQCGQVEGAAEAVAAAVAAAGDGSEAVQMLAPRTIMFSSARPLEMTLAWGLNQVLGEMWASSAGEGGPSLQQRVEWAVGVRDLVGSLARSVRTID